MDKKVIRILNLLTASYLMLAGMMIILELFKPGLVSSRLDFHILIISALVVAVFYALVPVSDIKPVPGWFVLISGWLWVLIAAVIYYKIRSITNFAIPIVMFAGAAGWLSLIALAKIDIKN